MSFVGGKIVKNVDGKIVDYLYRNDLTKNVALIEIKTPETKLLENEYRANIYSLSKSRKVKILWDSIRIVF